MLPKKEIVKNRYVYHFLKLNQEFIAGYTDEEIKALPKGEYIIFGDHSEHIKYVDFAFIQGADGLKILNTVSDVPKYIYYAFQNFYQKARSPKFNATSPFLN